MKKELALATSILLALGLSACGSDDDPKDDEATSAEAESVEEELQEEDELIELPNELIGVSKADLGEAGETIFYDTLIRLEIPAEPPQEVLDAAEAAGDEDVTFAKLVIDNRFAGNSTNPDNSGEFSVRSISLNDESGAGVDFDRIGDYQSDNWRELDDINAPIEDREISDDLEEYSVPSGRIGTVWMATSDELPDEATSIEVDPMYIEAEAAIMNLPDSGIQEHYPDYDFDFEDPNEN